MSYNQIKKKKGLLVLNAGRPCLSLDEHGLAFSHVLPNLLNTYQFESLRKLSQNYVHNKMLIIKIITL